MENPKIRFKEFKEENWEEKEIQDVSSIKRGERVTSKDTQLLCGYPVISGGIDKMGIYHKYNREGNTITISQYGTAGFVNFIKEKFWANDVCLSIFPKNNIDNSFLFLNLISKQNYFYSITNKTAIPFSISIKDIKKTLISLPKLNEQQKIANIFLSLDSLIENTNIKLEKLKNLKESLLNSMFVNDESNNKISTIKFNGFINKWKIVNLNMISKIFKGKGIPKKSVIHNGKNKCILYGELFTTYKSVIGIVKSKTNEYGYLSKANTLLFPSSSTSLKDYFPCSSLNEEQINLGGDINIFEIINGYDSNFLSYMFSSKHHLESVFLLTKGITINHLYSNDIKYYNFYTPNSLLEQQKIASLFMTIDNLISNIEIKYNKLLNIKESLLNNMLI